MNVASSPTAVLIEDEAQIRRFVRAALEAEGWRVFEADTGSRGVSECGTRHPELVIVDLGLPDRDGLDVIREVRAFSQVPIIVLSARSDEREKVAALDGGADDYLTKPFGVAELLARVRATTRRRQPSDAAESLIRIGAITIDVAARTVTRDGALVHLTPTEYRLLTTLAAHANKTLTQRFLLNAVWGPSHVDDGHYLRVFMANLRAKLETEPAQPRHFVTITGVGYRLATED
jgi:two-component system, OmpR family, KDP operon response regulator KdpE